MCNYSSSLTLFWHRLQQNAWLLKVRIMEVGPCIQEICILALRKIWNSIRCEITVLLQVREERLQGGIVAYQAQQAPVALFCVLLTIHGGNQLATVEARQ